MAPQVINIAEKFSTFTDQWCPKVIAEMDGIQFRLARLEGDFVWQRHPDTDEAFLVMEGELRMDFRRGNVVLGKGEMLVVPAGMEHKPSAQSGHVSERH